MPIPCISVVMAVYNGERYLQEAVDSILWQTFEDFEFIIIDDDSTDDSAQILDTFSDPRIVRIANKRQMGLSASLNKGIAFAKGEFIARMDADDISLPTRLEKQVNFLLKNPNISVLGSNIIFIDEFGNHIRQAIYPETPGLVRWSLLFKNSIAHPVVLFRKLLWDAGYRYDESMQATQDYDLWVRLSDKYSFYNLQEYLLLYRQHPNSISHSQLKIQKDLDFIVSKRAIEKTIGYPLSDETVKILRNFVRPLNDNAVKRAANLYILLQKNTKNWDLSCAERNHIRRLVSAILIRQWKSKYQSLSLAPILFYALYLNPQIINNQFLLFMKKLPVLRKAL